MLYPSLDHQVHESIDLIRSQADINSLASPIFITRWIVAFRDFSKLATKLN